MVPSVESATLPEGTEARTAEAALEGPQVATRQRSRAGESRLAFRTHTPSGGYRIVGIMSVIEDMSRLAVRARKMRDKKQRSASTSSGTVHVGGIVCLTRRRYMVVAWP
jgi:hypothetical protein